MKVVDASVALKWIVEEEGSGAARRLLTSDLVAPALLLGEVANGLWKKHRRGEVMREHALASLRNLPTLLAEILPFDSLIERATTIALDVDHPVYDCLYVALAERLQIPLVTADLKMVRLFAATRYHPLLEALA